MNEKEYIIAWLNEMIVKFDWITFRYEYSHKLFAHCIEVLPSDSIEQSEEYAYEEYDFSCKFEQTFGESVIFSDGTEFYKCSDSAIVIKNILEEKIEWTKDDVFNFNLDEYVLDFQCDDLINIESRIYTTCGTSEICSLDLAA